MDDYGFTQELLDINLFIARHGAGHRLFPRHRVAQQGRRWRATPDARGAAIVPLLVGSE